MTWRELCQAASAHVLVNSTNALRKGWRTSNARYRSDCFDECYHRDGDADSVNGCVLARQMGGDAPLYSSICTIKTCLSLVSIPIWFLASATVLLV